MVMEIRSETILGNGDIDRDEENFWIDGNVLHFNRGIGYMSLCICLRSEHYISSKEQKNQKW